jgi:hypothetical protein
LRILVSAFLVSILSASSGGQSPTGISSSKQSGDQFVEQARTRYYSPEEQGVDSFNCDVTVDWNTVPTVLLVPAELAGRSFLEKTKLRASLGRITGAKVQHEYPKDVPVLMTPVYDKFFDLLSNIVQAFLQTWAPKAMNGPIPAKYEILSAAPISGGYRLKVKAPAGQQVEVLVNNDYLLTEIITRTSNGQIDEHPSFSASSNGLLFTHNDAATTGDQTVHVQYDVDYQPVEGFDLPHRVHLQVDDNINVKFAFENCAVSHGTVIHFNPPRP